MAFPNILLVVFPLRNPPINDHCSLFIVLRPHCDSLSSVCISDVGQSQRYVTTQDNAQRKLVRAFLNFKFTAEGA